jgi:hypothetical protein
VFPIDVFLVVLRGVCILNAQDPLSELDGSGYLFYVASKCFEEYLVRVVVGIYEVTWNDVLSDKLLVEIEAVSLPEALEKLEDVVLADFTWVVERKDIEKYFLVKFRTCV